ncbi:MAG: cation:proton antiporter regulatory subunit, partial [Haloglomus sp.]
ARNLGSIIEGAYFETVDTDDLTLPLGDAFLEWVNVGPECPFVGQTLAEANVRQETGVSVLAVQRGPDTIANPDSDFEMQEGDILVTLGTREEQAELEALAAPESTDTDESSGSSEPDD